MAQAMASTCSSPTTLCSFASPARCIPHSSTPQVTLWQRRGEYLINAALAESSRASASWSIQHQVKPRVVAVRSKEGDETEAEVTEAPKAAISEKRAKAEAEVAKGQRTAIVTGAISVLLGVGYLVLIQLLDTRGVILVPPPPEAFNP